MSRLPIHTKRIFNTSTVPGDTLDEALEHLDLMGPGSLLDADLLDGLDSTAFAQPASSASVSGSWNFTEPPTIQDNTLWHDGNTSGRVTTVKIADDAVTSAKIDDGAVLEAAIADSQISAAKLKSNAVTTAAIADSSVTTAKLADGAVTAAKLSEAYFPEVNGINSLTWGSASPELRVTTISGWARHLSIAESSATDLASFGARGTGTALSYAYMAAGDDTYSNTDAAIRVYPSGEIRMYERLELHTAEGNNRVSIETDGSPSEFGDGLEVGGETVWHDGNTAGRIVEADIADDQISAAKIKANAVTSTELSDGAVTTNKLGDGAVTTVKILNDAVTTGKIASGAVTEGRLASGSVTEGKLGASSVSAGKLKSNSVTTDKVADGNITTGKLADGLVTGAKIAAGAVDTAAIADDAVTAAKLAVDSVSQSHIAPDSVGQSELKANSVATSELVDGNVTTAKLADGAVTAAKVAADVATQAELDAHTGNTSNPHAVTAAQIGADQLIAEIATADGPGSSLDADLLDGLHGSSYSRVENHQAPITTDGWYTVATQAGSRATAKFVIDWSEGGNHGTLTLIAEHHYGLGNSITVLTHTKYSTTEGILGVRIRDGSTYDGAMLQIDANPNASVSINVRCYHNHATGWILRDFVPDGTDPGGLGNYAAITNTASEVALWQFRDGSNGGMVVSGPISAGTASSQHEVWHGGNTDGLITTAKLADGAITSAKVAADAINTVAIVDDAITTAKLDSGAVTEAKLADGSVSASKLKSNAVTNAKLNDGSVTTAKIVDGNVTNAKLSTDSVQTGKIKDLNVTTAKLAAGAVTEAKLGASAVDSANIKADAVTTSAIADGNVTTAKVADGAITTAKVDSSAITTSLIADDAVTQAKLADDSVGQAQLTSDSVGSGELKSNAVTNGKILDGAVSTAKLADGAVTNAKIGAGAVATASIADAAVTPAKLAADAVTQAAIADDSVGSSQIKSNAVTNGKILDGAVSTAKLADGAVTPAKLSVPYLETSPGSTSTTIDWDGVNLELEVVTTGGWARELKFGEASGTSRARFGAYGGGATPTYAYFALGDGGYLNQDAAVRVYPSGIVRAYERFQVSSTEGGLGADIHTDGTQSIFTGGLDITGDVDVAGDLGLTGDLDVVGVVESDGFAMSANSSVRIAFPGGAGFTGDSSSELGAVYIKLPQHRTNTMMRFRVSFFEYLSDKSFDLIISGYNWSGGNWGQMTAVIVGANPDPVTVRFIDDGTECAVAIGEITDTWSYPKVVVTEWVGSHIAYSTDLWASGWVISLRTAAWPGGSVISKTATVPWNSLNDGTGSGLDADLLDGLEGAAYGKVDAENSWTQRQIFPDGIDVGSGISKEDTNNSVVLLPAGATYSQNNANVTGSFCIRIPTAAEGTNGMVRFRVSCFSYVHKDSFEIILSGYTHSSAWINCSAEVVSGKSRDLTVRFTSDGTDARVYVGDLDEVWQYPQWRIMEVVTGYQGANAGLWQEGWQLTLEASAFAGTVDSTVTADLNATLLEGHAASAFATSSLADTISGLWNFTTAPTIQDNTIWHQGNLTPIASGSTGLFADGTVTAPSISFTSDPNTGLYRYGEGRVGITSNGILSLLTTSTGRVGFTEGAAATPALHFFNDSNTGLYRPGENQIGFATGGVERAVLSGTQLTLRSGVLLNNNSDSSYDKLRVWSSSFYTIGMHASNSFGYLNDYAMTFTMNNDSNRGWLFRHADQETSDGAMSLTTGGKLKVKAWIDTPLFIAGAGSAAAPSITFDGDENTGIYRSGADVIAFASGGALRATIGGNFTIQSGVIKNKDGTVSVPAYSFGDDTDTGMYRPGADHIAFTNAGARTFQLNTGVGQFEVPVRVPTGTADAPSLYFYTDTNTGLYRPAENSLAVTAGGIRNLTASATQLEVEVPLVVGGNKLYAEMGSHLHDGKWELWPDGGAQVLTNSEFWGGVAESWALYDNAASGSLVLTFVADSTTPNGSGYHADLTYTTGGSAPSPSWGGISHTAGIGEYERGDYLLFRILAKIPVSRSLSYTSNATGAETDTIWLTSQAGTGDWKTYLVLRKIGETGTFNSTGFLFIWGGADSTFSWQIARAEAIACNRKLNVIERSDELYFRTAADALWRDGNTDGRITTPKLADGLITAAKIAADAVNTVAIADDAITAAKIAPDSVSQGNITADAVGQSELKANAVASTHIVDGAVTTAKIVDGNVTNAKLGSNSVQTNKILDANVTSAKIADGAVTEGKLGAGSVSTAKIKANAITATEIVDGAVTAAKIADGSISESKLSFTTATQAELDSHDHNGEYLDEVSGANEAKWNGVHIQMGPTAPTGGWSRAFAVGSFAGTEKAWFGALGSADDSVSYAYMSAGLDSYNNTDARFHIAASGYHGLYGLQLSIYNQAASRRVWLRMDGSPSEFDDGLQVAVGSVAAPSIAFAGDANTGLYRIGTNDLGIAAAGTECVSITAGRAEFAVDIRMPQGSADSPGLAFVGDVDTGIYRSAANTIGFATSGALRLAIDSVKAEFAGEVRAAAGSAGSPAFNFTGDENSGMYSISADAVGFSVGSALGARLDSDGLEVTNLVEAKAFVSDGTAIGHVMFPEGASRSWSGNPSTGAIAIKLGRYATSTMLSFKVTIFDYAMKESFEVFCAGYPYSAPAWANTTAYIVGEGERDFTVRFTTDSSGLANYVYIGELTDTWHYLDVTVTELVVAHANYNPVDWATDWDIELESSAFVGTVNKTHSSIQIGKYHNGSEIWHDGNTSGRVVTADLADGLITSAKVAAAAIATVSLADDSVSTAKIIDAAVTEGKIGTDAVSAVKLKSNSVTTAKITDGNVTTAKVADGAITAAKVAADVATQAELDAHDHDAAYLGVAAGAVASASLADGAVTEAKLATDAVSAAKLKANAVTTAKILDGNVTAAKIADGAISAAKVAADVATQAELDAHDHDGDYSPVSHDHDGDYLSKVTAGAVNTTNIADDAVTAAKLADDAVTTDSIDNGAVTAAKLAAGIAGVSSIQSVPLNFTGLERSLGVSGGASSTIAGAADRIDVFPFQASEEVVLSALKVEVTTAKSGDIRIVIYSANSDGTPSGKFAESAELSTASTGDLTWTTSQTLLRGRLYWIGVHYGAGATLRAVDNSDLHPLNFVSGSEDPATGYRRTGVTFSTTSPASFGSGSLSPMDAPAVRLVFA